MDLDTETMARFLGAICRQAIRDYRDGWHEPGYPDAAEFLWEAGLLHANGTIGRPDRETPPGPLPRKLRPRGTRQLRRSRAQAARRTPRSNAKRSLTRQVAVGSKR